MSSLKKVYYDNWEAEEEFTHYSLKLYYAFILKNLYIVSIDK